jgi:hypothetical protein
MRACQRETVGPRQNETPSVWEVGCDNLHFTNETRKIIERLSPQLLLEKYQGGFPKFRIHQYKADAPADGIIISHIYAELFLVALHSRLYYTTETLEVILTAQALYAELFLVGGVLLSHLLQSYSRLGAFYESHPPNLQ